MDIQFNWPDISEIEVPILEDRPPFNVKGGFHPMDRNWRINLIRDFEKGLVLLPNKKEESIEEIRKRVKRVVERTYFAARVTQLYFKNPSFNNYTDPFLESMLMLLTWRNKINNAHQVLNRLIEEFDKPTDILFDENLGKVKEIVEKTGYSNKRPQMIVELVRKFSEKFPKGDFSTMSHWSDEKILVFLTSISGIGKKSALCVMMYSLGRFRFPIDAHVRRVLRRTNMLNEIFHENKYLNHKDYQTIVENFIPPSMRVQLHTGLLKVGQDFCVSKSPKCASCPINKVCEHFRKQKIEERIKSNFLHVCLFSGAGGFSQGLGEAGFRTILAADINEEALQTFTLNHWATPRRNIVQCDLGEITVDDFFENIALEIDSYSNNKIDVITAGIPCQGFSKAGYRTRPNMEYEVTKDPRNQLFEVVVEWTRKLQPKYVVIENVPGIESAGEGEENILHQVQQAFGELSYTANFDTLNAEDFGVPQKRHRFVLIANHPDWPEITINELTTYHQSPKTLWEQINHYPILEANDGNWIVLSDDKILTGHKSRYNNDFDLEIYKTILPGEAYSDYVIRRSDVIKRRENESDLKIYSTKSFSDKYYKLSALQPSRTIVAHLKRDGNGYIHPFQTRSITPREAARIQGFNDDFVFTGSRGSQFTQIGNAVPPPLAKAIGELIRNKISEKTNESEEIY